MQPILVRPVDGNRFEIVVHESAAPLAQSVRQRAALTEVPALVKVPDIRLLDHNALAIGADRETCSART